MTAYRYRRRSFLAGIGGAFGLEILLRNLEASAAGTPSPPRFLMTHFPNGSVRQQFLPSEAGTSFVISPILQPFEDAGLREDLIVLYGLHHNGLTANGGGGPEAGTVFATTGASSPGTRANGGETDDSVAGGASWDQIFLAHVPELAQRDASGTVIGPGYVNAICDGRVDSYETSTRCLSYARQTRSVESSRPGGPIVEHTPLLPELSPARLYATLFSGFMPGGSPEAALKALRMRKSVLDSALRDVARLSQLAPADERAKIDAHAEHVRRLEAQIAQRIADGGGGTACVLPESPPETLVGKASDATSTAGNPVATEADNETHEAVGRTHLAIIRTAFQCDLIRVASFQWMPGTGHVALSGLDPNDPDTIYYFRSLSRRALSAPFWDGPRPATDAYVYDVFKNAHIWYNLRMAAILSEFKAATDMFGNNLLDHTIVPFITDLANPGTARSPAPALIVGGRALGMQGGQFQNFSPLRPHNDLWATIAQAYFRTDTPLSVPGLAGEAFYKTGVAPIPGLWAPPT